MMEDFFLDIVYKDKKSEVPCDVSASSVEFADE